MTSNLATLSEYKTDIDYSISSDYSSVIEKQENYSYKIGNVVTLSLSLKFTGSITSYTPFCTITPAPKQITYCVMQSVSDGTTIPAFIESNGSIKSRFSKTLSGFYGISATYAI